MKYYILLIASFIFGIAILFFRWGCDKQTKVTKELRETKTYSAGEKDTVENYEFIHKKTKLTPAFSSQGIKNYVVNIDTNNQKLNLNISTQYNSDTLELEFFSAISHKTISSTDTFTIERKEIIASEIPVGDELETKFGKMLYLLIGALTGIIAAFLLITNK